MTDEQTRSVLLVVLGATAIWLVERGGAQLRPAGLSPTCWPAGSSWGCWGCCRRSASSASRRPVRAFCGGHQHTARVGWLLLVPVLVVLLVQPAALGSYAVSSRSVVPGGGDDQYLPLAAPVQGAVPMSMAEFVTARSATPASR